MNAFEVFIVIILAAASVAIIYDIYLLRHHLPTISAETAAIAKRAPITACLFGLTIGILYGHFFWQMC